jgi:hypothetical protein
MPPPPENAAPQGDGGADVALCKETGNCVKLAASTSVHAQVNDASGFFRPKPPVFVERTDAKTLTSPPGEQ